MGDNQEIQSHLTDKDNGQYVVKYQVDDEAEVKIDILFEDDKGKMVSVRGSPYRAAFSSKAQPPSNNLTGPAMGKYIQSGLEEMHSFIVETTKGA